MDCAFSVLRAMVDGVCVDVETERLVGGYTLGLL
jgi:hypothetical protein